MSPAGTGVSPTNVTGAGFCPGAWVPPWFVHVEAVPSDAVRTCRVAVNSARRFPMRVLGRATVLDVIGRVYLLHGEVVRVLARWGPGGGPRNVLIELPDGRRVVRPFRGLRRPRGRS